MKSLSKPLPAWRAASCLCATLLAPALAAADDAAAPQRIEIIGTTALPGIGSPANQIPANVQTIRASGLGSDRALNLSQALAQGGASVNLNDTAGNPFQADLNFRGFTASPALGTPQGLSVFVDGVRINEAFGDTVNWDLIPDVAISSTTLIPGSDPVFGLNTLGGAINVKTTNGRESPGTSVRAYGGSWGRGAIEFRSGGSSEESDWFVAANRFHEAGWADFNPSSVAQLFGKAGWHDARTDVDLSVTLVDNRLEGNQSLPLSWMNDRAQAYSWPDTQTNRLAFVVLKGSRSLDDDWLLEGAASYRAHQSHAFNSNVNNHFDPAQPVGPGNQPTGNAVNRIDETRPGASLQLSSLADLAGHRNHFVVGASLDEGRTAFTQFSQEGGSARDTASNSPLLLATSLRSQASAGGAYFADTWGLDAKTYLSVSGRYNQARVRLADQLGSALDGDHGFQRFNPAVGLTWNPSKAMTAYASYNEGMRVPTPVELSCADPNAPCSLPNAFASDPALKPVVSRTQEFGARGRAGAQWNWSAALFRTRLGDDIQFISSGGGATSAGYFQNVGQTRRQGFELGFEGSAGAWKLSGHYSRIAATFRSPLVLNSPSNSSASPSSCADANACRDIQVRPGDRMPGIPLQTFKLHAEYAFGKAFSLGADLAAQSSAYARGDENNRDANGPVPGFALLNLDAHYRFAPGWELFAKVDNVFDRVYSSFGVLGQNVFTGQGRSFDPTGASWRNEQFRSIGAPRGIWLGVSYRFGAADF
ncbi:MAG: TonB-dependent receptor [Burkholderiales bacterium]|nr:TonB-dependent receptor [Burkholderiales bacterium]